MHDKPLLEFDRARAEERAERAPLEAIAELGKTLTVRSDLEFEAVKRLPRGLTQVVCSYINYTVKNHLAGAADKAKRPHSPGSQKEIEGYLLTSHLNSVGGVYDGFTIKAVHVLSRDEITASFDLGRHGYHVLAGVNTGCATPAVARWFYDTCVRLLDSLGDSLF